MSNPIHLGWDKVKVGDRVKYYSPVQGNQTGIVVEVLAYRGWLDSKKIYVQPISTAAAKRGEVSHDLMTVNHSLWEIF